MDNLPNLSIVKSDDNPKSTVLKQDMSAIRRSNMVARLPTSFKSILHRHYARKFEITLANVDSGNGFGGDFEKQVAEDPGLPGEIKKSIREIVSWVSFVQTFKGLFTAGITRSVRYVYAKVGKWWSGRKSL